MSGPPTVLSKEMVFAIAAVFLCSLGFGAVILGYALSWLLTLRWSGRTAAADAATAVGMALACAIAMASLGLDAGRGPIWIGVVALLSVVLRHVARRPASRAATEGAA